MSDSLYINYPKGAGNSAVHLPILSKVKFTKTKAYQDTKKQAKLLGLADTQVTKFFGG